MKKLIFMTLLTLITLGFVACDGKGKKKELAAVEATAKVNVERYIGMDREYMGINYNSGYRWYETCILLQDYLDAPEQDGTIAGVSNIFYVITETDKGGFDGMAVQVAHGASGNDTIITQRGLWIEDFDMSDDPIKITFKEAYEKIMAVNFPKPHSRHCVLRKQVGPKAANPQYIFGNLQAQLYVDAVTGAVSDKNPAFSGLGKPLGEWP